MFKYLLLTFHFWIRLILRPTFLETIFHFTQEIFHVDQNINFTTFPL